MVAQLQEEEAMSTVTLRGILNDVLKTTDLTDPHEIAQAILKRVPESQHVEVLHLLMVDYVRHYLGAQRTSAKLPPLSALPKVITSHHAGGVKSKSTSPKVTAIREGWQRHLRERISIGNGAYRLLEQCTYDDLMHAAKQREKIADANKAWARRFHAYAALLTEFDVKTFGELPAEVHMKVLGAAA